MNNKNYKKKRTEYSVMLYLGLLLTLNNITVIESIHFSASIRKDLRANHNINNNELKSLGAAVD